MDQEAENGTALCWNVVEVLFGLLQASGQDTQLILAGYDDV